MLGPAQNINAIAYATLEDRMVRELSTSLPAGPQDLELVQHSPRRSGPVSTVFRADIDGRVTQFHVIHRLNSYPLGN